MFNPKRQTEQGTTLPDSKKSLHRNLDFTSLEQYKLLRANLAFTLPAGEHCPIIGVTSSTRGEGKSTTAINLSYVLAESGKRVLLIDADMRLPSVAKKMGIRGAPGLSNLLVDPEPQSLGAFKSPVSDDWYIIPAGDLPPNPSELLGSKTMERLLNVASEKFDYIVLDLPPVNIVSDAIAVARMISGMLLVVREDYTLKKELNECVRHLQLSEVKVLGIVQNGAKSESSSFKKYKYGTRNKYYRRSYYAYASGSGKTDKPADKKHDKQ